jgi:hypothetical protein
MAGDMLSTRVQRTVTVTVPVYPNDDCENENETSTVQGDPCPGGGVGPPCAWFTNRGDVTTTILDEFTGRLYTVWILRAVLLLLQGGQRSLIGTVGIVEASKRGKGEWSAITRTD